MSIPTASKKDADVVVEPMTTAKDVTEGFNCLCAAFGTQINDAIWTGFNPGWDTEEGKAAGAARLLERFSNIKKDIQGNATDVFLKATLPDENGRYMTAGMAIWTQLSMVEGWGNTPSDDVSGEVATLHPGDEAQQRFLCQMWRSLVKRRVDTVKEKEKATEQPPAVLTLDACGVDPAYQGRGIASKLVQWGIDEARRRGGLECTTEASSMGRRVYERLGFRMGPEIVYVVDEEFAGRDKPSNVFMRTGGGRL